MLIESKLATLVLILFQTIEIFLLKEIFLQYVNILVSTETKLDDSFATSQFLDMEWKIMI